MFRIMIVDDEYTIRKGLINFIDWKALDCVVVCETENGILAKDLIEFEFPDIVITDIRMPGLDGIELAKYIYQNYSSIKVILLTGYSDFEYAQSAIKFNVVDFVLKPSSTEKIVLAVDMAKKLIIDEQAKINKLQTLEDEVKEIHDQMQEKFIHDLLKGIYLNEEFIINRFNQLKINITNFYLVVYRIHDIKTIESHINVVNKGSFLIEIRNFISLVFKTFHSYTLILNNDSICNLISFESNDHYTNTQDILRKNQEILDFVSSFINISIIIGISDMHSNPTDIQIAFNEAQKSLANKFYDDGNIFIYSAQTIPNDSSVETITTNFVDNIIKYVEFDNSKEAIRELYKLIGYQKSSKEPIENIKTTSILLYSLCSRLLNEYNINSSDVIIDSENIYKSIINCQSIASLSAIIENIIDSTTFSLCSINTESNYLIKKVINYIKDNYNTSIKLDTLADVVHINSCYLSRLFKKETGSTLTETITNIRIKKAKELLVSKNNKTYEIASMVGFEDPAYFSCVFKKHTGLSPNHYRKQNI